MSQDARGLLEALLGSRQERREDAVGGVIHGVDVRRLLEYVFADFPQPGRDEDMERLERIVDEVNALTRMLLNAYLSDGISRIVHPRYGMSVVRARFSEIVVSMRRMIEDEWRRVRELMAAGAPGDEVEAAAARAERVTHFLFIVATELYVRLVTLMHINAPARARPPLVNTVLGFELLR